jgi:hypothetical protein
MAVSPQTMRGISLECNTATTLATRGGIGLMAGLPVPNNDQQRGESPYPILIDHGIPVRLPT